MERLMLRRIKRLLYRSLSLIKKSSPRPPRSPPIFVRYTGAKPFQLPDDGDDGKHWLIEVKEPVGSRDEIIDNYVKLVAQVLGSEDEARNTIYSVSTKYYFAIGVLVSRDVAYKWKQLPDVISVESDGYVDPVTKDYGEPFVDGKPVPYDPKHHDFYHRVQARIRAWKSGTTINDMMMQDGGPAAGHIPTPAGSMPSQEYQVPPSNQFSGVNYNAGDFGCADNMALEFLQQPSCVAPETGVHQDEIARSSGLPLEAVTKSLDVLVEEGLVY